MPPICPSSILAMIRTEKDEMAKLLSLLDAGTAWKPLLFCTVIFILILILLFLNVLDSFSICCKSFCTTLVIRMPYLVCARLVCEVCFCPWYRVLRWHCEVTVTVWSALPKSTPVCPTHATGLLVQYRLGSHPVFSISTRRFESILSGCCWMFCWSFLILFRCFLVVCVHGGSVLCHVGGADVFKKLGV